MENQWNFEFLKWLEQKDSLFKRFDELATLLQCFLFGYVLHSHDNAKIVAERFPDVLEHCDSITYEEYGTAEAYSILHFLDRYHRFQLILVNFIEQNLLPITNYELDNLDVGTGPAPALFALSDIYSLLRQFGEEKNIKLLKTIRFKNDYVERSQRLRNWLHYFTEYVNSSNNLYDWQIPYHHGSFYDFEDLDFTKTFVDTDYDDEGYREYKPYTVKYRYNLIIFSYFLTKIEQVDRYAQKLYKSALYLRNKGLLLVVGARRSEDKKYKEIYSKVAEIIEHGNYNNWKFIGNCKEFELKHNQMSYSYVDRFGERLKAFLKDILQRMKELRIEDSIPTRVLKATHPDYSYEVNWEIHIFKKFSRMRKRSRSK